MSRHYDIIIIGGGQAGLAMGYHLAQRGFDFLILDAEAETGASWRKRWDSLTLFTDARHSALPGMPFRADADHLPHKDEVADYLLSYARQHGLPIRHGETVVKLSYLSEWRGFVVTTNTAIYETEQVVVATGPYHAPVIPPMAGTLATHVLQLHSSQYRSPAQLPADGNVLVVGGGNSGVQIAAELARMRRTWLSVGSQLPRLPQRVMGRSIFWWLDTTGAMDVTIHSFMGSRASKREFLIGKSLREAASVDSVSLARRAVGAEGDLIFTADDVALQVTSVIWATGFRQDFRWIDAPVFDQHRNPLHLRGITGVRGLYFLGLPWQHTRGSALLGWVGRDAAYLATRIAS